MSTTAFVLGNGESRKGIRIQDLKQHGTVFACNGVYRSEEPDFLIAVDPKYQYTGLPALLFYKGFQHVKQKGKQCFSG